MEVGFRIVIVSAGDSEFIGQYSGFQIQDSRFHKQDFPRFRILQVKTSQIRDPDTLARAECLVLQVFKAS